MENQSGQQKSLIASPDGERGQSSSIESHCISLRGSPSEQERLRKENEQIEIEKRREWVRDAMELQMLPAPAPKGLARPVPKDLE